ncbi:Hypothetical protein NTJ_01910 [Nesidiocoris tenuis]|uniref:Uncharacterized protein n=1 Tax=Nesidiocoris tenuis TaxID=355587 RepID=A0ABN7AAQ6_9HEMI|nr:Hypothetical protein NTJ_01910 [Nesidiocoris tenuis]
MSRSAVASGRVGGGAAVALGDRTLASHMTDALFRASPPHFSPTPHFQYAHASVPRDAPGVDRVRDRWTVGRFRLSRPFLK